jgi:hypothetical protein
MSMLLVGLSAAALGIAGHHVPDNEGVGLLVIVPSSLERPEITLSIADAADLSYVLDVKEEVATGGWSSSTSGSVIGRQDSPMETLDALYAGEIRDAEGQAKTPARLLDATSWKVLIDIRGESTREPVLVGVTSRSGTAAHALVTPDAEGTCGHVRLDWPEEQTGLNRLSDQAFLLLPTCSSAESSEPVAYRSELLMKPPLTDIANGRVASVLPLVVVVADPMSPHSDIREDGVDDGWSKPLPFRLFQTSAVTDGSARAAGRWTDLRITPSPLFPETFGWEAYGSLDASWSLTDPQGVNRSESRRVAASVVLGVGTSALVAAVGAFFGVRRRD